MNSLNPCASAVVPDRFVNARRVPDRLFGAGGDASQCMVAIARKWRLRAMQLSFCSSAASYQCYLFKSPASQHAHQCRLV